MKKNKFILIGAALVFLFSVLVMTGCEEEKEKNPFAGNWTGTVAFDGLGAAATINVTETTWTFSCPSAQMMETGTYTFNGKSATLTQLAYTFGTATVSGNSLTVTIVSGDFAGGIGTFSKN